MTSTGQSLLEAAEKDPGDRLATLALADHLEELGAAPVTVRALTVDGPTVLVFGYPENATTDMVHRLEEVSDEIARYLSRECGCPIGHLVLPANVTIRQIELQALPPAKEKLTSG